MKGSWTADQCRYIEWVATPRYTRMPPTQEMLAAEMGVTDVTLWRWSKLEGFDEEVTKLARASVGKKLPEIYGALIREAESGSYQHIELTLKMTGEYVPLQKNVNQQEGVVEVVVKTEGTSSIRKHIASGAASGNPGDGEI